MPLFFKEKKMPEKFFHVIPKKVLYSCDECDNGWLEFNGATKQGIDNKPVFVHSCTECKKLFFLKKQYPAIKFDEIKEVE